MVIRRPVAFKRGGSGPFIADAQEMLAKLGFDPGGPEGVFVSRTEDAVRAFQREYGLEVTGILDCATLKLLYEEVDPQGYPAVLMEGTGAAAGEETASVAGATRGAPDRTIVISVGERALGLYEGDRLVRRYPVAIGKPSTPTPVGTHRILEKILYPGGGLGTRWMAFTYQMHGIHGTNRPELIGQAVSNGCVRMYNEDVEELYDLVDVGTPVIVIAGPVESWPSMGKAGSEGAPQPVGAGVGSGTGGQQGGLHGSRPGFGSGLGSGSGMGGGTGGGTGAASPGAGPGGGAGGGPWGSPGGSWGSPGGSWGGPGGPLSGPGGGPGGGPAGSSGGGLWSPGSPRPKDAPGGGGRTYIVQPGDSLWSIAQRFGTTMDAIVATNNIVNPDLIYPGDVLKIP